MQNPNNLPSQVLMAKYFPKTQFMNAKLGAYPSFAWRSILQGREVLRRGLRWKVGNGCDIKIYTDRWMPRPTSFTIYAPPILGMECRVSKLICQLSRNWKTQLVQQSFYEHDAETILSIPLSARLPVDRMMWHFERSGIYTIKSGYKVARNMLREMEQQGDEAGGPVGSKFPNLVEPIMAIKSS